MSKYLSTNIANYNLAKPKFMADEFAANTFWHHYRMQFPILYRVALPVLDPPVSYSSSERVLLAVNIIVNRDRARFSAETLEQIDVVRYLCED